MLKSILYIFLSVFMLSAIAIEKVDNIVAVVDTDVITQAELNQEMQYVHAHLTATNQVVPPAKQLEKQVVEHMINERIEISYAANLGLQIDDYALSQAIDRIAKDNNQTLSEFKATVEKQSQDFASFREEIRKQMLLNRLHQQMVASKVVVSEDDIAKFIASPQGQDETGMEFLVSHILITLPDSPTPEQIAQTKSRAQQLMQKIKQGEDFSQVALLHSKDDQALTGKSLGWLTAAQLPTIFVKDVLAMQAGEVRGPLKSSSGFHIIKLKDKKIPETRHQVTQTHVRRIVMYPNANQSDKKIQQVLTELKQKINTAEDFITIAAKYNEDTSSKDRKGDLGWIVPNQLPTTLAKAVDVLMPGEVSEPISTGKSWQLLQVVDRRTVDDTKSFVQNKARQYVFQQKFKESLLAWQRKLRDQTYVDVRI